MRIFRRIFTLFALLAVAFRGILTFLDWFERQESVEMNWSDDEEMEEAF